ncbi:MAG: pilus assembly protein PilM [Myxococcota bacterium]|nr:pilus assembly protein PilM [Myxococcota bacterium]
MARILGLDLGSHSVKGLLLDASGRGPAQLKSFHSVRRNTEGDRLQTLKDAVQQLLSVPELHAEQVIVSLPGATVTTHQVALPFTDPKRIDQTLSFEVEEQLPYDVSEAAFDYQVASAQTNKSELLIGVVKREELRALLEALSEAKIDPRVVTHPAFVYQSILAQPTLEEIPENEAVAIVDLGHERTAIAIGRPRGAVEWARTFPGGGRDLTRVLAAEFGTAPLEAESWKESHGALADAISGPEGERGASAFLRALQPILRELRATFKAYGARTRKQVTRVYLCGGTAQLPGLATQLGHDLGVSCSVLPMPEGQTPAAAQAYALALRGVQTPARAPRFNLRKGEFAFKGDFDYLRDRLGLLASYAATLLVLLVASMLVRSTMLGRRERALDTALCDVTQKVLGRCEKNYDRALSMLQGVESPAAVVPRLSAVSLLAEVTDRVPPELSVSFDQIQVDLERISIRGETATSRSVDELTAALRGYPCFQDVKQGRLERSRDGQKFSFRLDIDVQCPAEGAAARL